MATAARGWTPRYLSASGSVPRRNDRWIDLHRDFCQSGVMDNKEPSAARIEDGVFLGFVLIVSVAFALVLEPFFAALFLGVIAAILFAPVHPCLVGARNRVVLGKSVSV